MTKRWMRAKALVALLCAGPVLFQLGSCTSQDVRVQLSRGFTTALNGMLGIITADLANQLFDVDD